MIQELNLWPSVCKTDALTNWANHPLWTSLWDLHPWKSVLQTLPITALARDDGGYRGIRTLPSGATNLHAQKPIHYIPHHIQRDRTRTCNHWYPKPAFYHLKYSLIHSEDRGHAPQTLSGSHYLAGRFWTFQIYLP